MTGTNQFTGKERDAETGLDYFWLGTSGAQGRFTSPDEFAGGIVIRSRGSMTSPCHYKVDFAKWERDSSS